MEPFYLHPRGRIFYAQIVNPLTKKLMTAKSTRVKSRAEAHRIVEKWLSEGKVNSGNKSKPLETMYRVETILEAVSDDSFSQKDAEKVLERMKSKGLISTYFLARSNKIESRSYVDYLLETWDPKRSAYIRRKNDLDKSASEGYYNYMMASVKNHFAPFFGDRPIGEIDTNSLREFYNHLRNKLNEKTKTLAINTVKKVMSAGTVPLKFLFDEKMLSYDPTHGLEKAKSKVQLERDIIPEELISKIFVLPWDCPVARACNLTATLTGMRSGEIRALKHKHIHENKILVEHAILKEKN